VVSPGCAGGGRFDIGVQEFMVMLLIALVCFGGEKLPEIVKG
jgi:Sec-independent protein translocase protein TatA